MTKSVRVQISIVDSEDKPVKDLRASMYFGDDLLLPEFNVTRGYIDYAGIPLGSVRLILTRSGRKVYDKGIDVNPPKGQQTFTTTIVIE